MTRPGTATRIAVALFALMAWLSAANHCVFGDAALQRSAKVSQHPGCPGHNAPIKSDGGDNEVACCKSFPEASLSLSKNVGGYDPVLSSVHVSLFTAIISPAHSQLALRPLELDTGPPFARSVVEFVLQRSLQAHAPPSVV